VYVPFDRAHCKFIASGRIVAGALQVMGALDVAPTSTCGKGTRQQFFYLKILYRLSDLAHIRDLELTTCKFYLASGASTELRAPLRHRIYRHC